MNSDLNMELELKSDTYLHSGLALNLCSDLKLDTNLVKWSSDEVLETHLEFEFSLKFDKNLKLNLGLIGLRFRFENKFAIYIEFETRLGFGNEFEYEDQEFKLHSDMEIDYDLELNRYF